MKLKTKLVSILGAAAIATSSLPMIASCTFTRNNWTCPKVTFDGDNVMKPDAGKKKFTLDGFSYDRDLSPDEKVTVRVIDPSTKNPSEYVTAIANRPNKAHQFSIEFTASVVSDYENKDFAFTLEFDVTYKDKSGTYKDLPDSFTFKYAAAWEPNAITTNLSTYTANYNNETGEIEFDINGTIKRTLRENEKLVVNVTGNQVVKCYDYIITPIENANDQANITLRFLLDGQNRFNDYQKSFGLEIDFIGSSGKVEFPQSIDGTGTVKYKRDYIPVEVQLEEQTTNAFFATDGETECRLTDGTLKFSRNLSPQNAYNEKLEMSLVNGSRQAVSDLKLECDYTTSQIYDVIIKYVGEELYVEKTYDDLNIKWTITEQVGSDLRDAEKSEGLIPITFTYRGVWLEKTASYFGANQEQTTIPFEIEEAGKRELTITSYKNKDGGGYERNAYGFDINKTLSEGEKVSLVLTNLDPETKKPVEDESTAPLELTSNTPTMVEFTDVDNIEKELLKLSIKYKDSWFDADSTRVDEEQTNYFNLTFVYAVTGTTFTYTQEINKIFSLKYKPNTLEKNKLNLSLKDEYIGESHGDTIIKVTGSITNRAFDKNKDKFLGEDGDVTVTSENNAISVVKKTKAGEVGYENYIEFDDDSSSFSMYVKIDSTKLSGVYDKDKTFKDVKFTIKLQTKDASGDWVPYYVEPTTDITYSGFSNELTDYIKARTIPIAMYYHDSENDVWVPNFISAWIVGDATPKVDTDFDFYVATSWDSAELYKNNLSKAGYDSFRVGITDPTFSTNYAYYQFWLGDWYLTDYQKASFYRKNYIYFDVDTEKQESVINWIDPAQTSVWQDATSKTPKYGCNIRVGEINFDNAFKDYTGTEDVSDPALIAAYMNKLIKLNNYDDLYGHINGIVENPITNTKANRKKYKNFGMSGFQAQQRNYWTDEEKEIDVGNWTMSLWNDYTFTSQENGDPALNYISSEKFRSSLSSSYPLSTNGSVYMYEGSPVYEANKTLSCGIWNGAGYYEIEALNGSMIVVRDENPEDPNEDKVKLLGVYWGWPSDHSSGSRFYPLFDAFIDEDGHNLLEKYLNHHDPKKY